VTPLVELRHVSVSFGSTIALSGVDFDLLPGEAHVVAGENGAGKSTLIRVLSGALSRYSGELLRDGRPARFRGPADAALAGIAAIYQELSLVPTLSVADNLALGGPAKPLAVLHRGALRTSAREALARVGLDIDPDASVERLTLAERQLVEIARALSRNARILVMDEPTSALTESETDRLLRIVRELLGKGVGVVYISHRMKEIERVADRISVLRDGRRVLVAERGRLSRDELVAAMLGRRPVEGLVRSSTGDRSVRLLTRDLSASGPPEFRALSLDIGAGEIVGLAGAEGSGASSVLRVLGGDLPATGGRIQLDGASYSAKSPRAAHGRQVAFLARDRHASVLSNLIVKDNGMLSSSLGGALSVIDAAGERRTLEPEVARLRIKAPSLDANAGSLSGGNQPKVALLRCLMSKPRVLLLDDPARGVDLGAKADLFARLHELAADGTSILFHSSDLSELAEHADRVLVFFRGAVVAELARHELDEERLLAPVMGASA
jgi:ABC-type sugar transport system ATPase subunit